MEATGAGPFHLHLHLVIRRPSERLRPAGGRLCPRLLTVSRGQSTRGLGPPPPLHACPLVGAAVRTTEFAHRSVTRTKNNHTKLSASAVPWRTDGSLAGPRSDGAQPSGGPLVSPSRTLPRFP